jgi:uncharacterized membrane protein
VLTVLTDYLIAVINVIGGTTVVLSLVLGLGPFVKSVIRGTPSPTVSVVRSRLGRGLVLSLEIFIAADLLRSVLAPTLQDVTILALITLIRIALSLSLEHELRTVAPAERESGDT